MHRDLKPENIMLDKNNILKIVDFGLAKETVLGVGSTMNVKGTKQWMAPEQVSHSSPLVLSSLSHSPCFTADELRFHFCTAL